MFPLLDGLFPANTPAEIIIYDNKKNKYGEDEILYKGDVMCNITTKSHKTINSNGKLESYLVSTMYVFQDLSLNDDIVTNGEVIINNHKYNIINGMTQRDPFNNEYMFLKLELI